MKALKGGEGEKRLRVGDYRVRFTEESPEAQEEGNKDERALRIHSVRNRSEAYRSLAAREIFASAC